MNEMIKSMVQPLIDAFSAYEIKSPAIQREVDDFKAELTAFAEQFTDMMEYYNQFASSGLQSKYTDIISKVATAAYVSDDAGQNNQQSSAPKITVKEFLEQYKTAYDEICKRGSVRGRKAYEAIFNVANRTDDMLEAQIILEKERLLWKIVSEDAIETFEKKLEEMDPLFLATTSVLLGQLDAYKKANSQEELEYELSIQEFDNWKIILDYTCRMNIATSLAKGLVEYIKAKEDVYEWNTENQARNGTLGMISKKSSIRALISYTENYLGLTIDELFEDPKTNIWMLTPKNIDEYGRRREVFAPQLLDELRDVLDNEIIADISVVEALLR